MRQLRLILPLTVLCLGIPLNSKARPSPMTVVVDAGHGGKDRGTSRNEIYECDITLQVATYLQNMLTRDPGFRVILSRPGVHGMSLLDRARVAKENKADLLLSIHVNSSPDTRARGAEFYFQNQLPPDEESMFLAHKENGGEDTATQAPTYEFLDRHRYPADVAVIVADLLDSERAWRSSLFAKSLKSSWRGSHKKFTANSIHQAPFFLLNQMTTPSTLIELGFLTNPDDFRDLTDPRRLKGMAEDLYQGLKAYKESMDKGSRAP